MQPLQVHPTHRSITFCTAQCKSMKTFYTVSSTLAYTQLRQRHVQRLTIETNHWVIVFIVSSIHWRRTWTKCSLHYATPWLLRGYHRCICHTFSKLLITYRPFRWKPLLALRTQSPFFGAIQQKSIFPVAFLSLMTLPTPSRSQSGKK